MSQSSVTFENGWALYAHPLFIERLQNLTDEVRELMETHPDTFHRHPVYELFEGVDDNIRLHVPANPGHSRYRQGSKLGKHYKHWFRVKKNTLPPRYRLFFQYRSEAPKTIIYAWLNDAKTIRRDGDKNDVYEVFKSMLANGKMPNSYDALRQSCEMLPGGVASDGEEP